MNRLSLARRTQIIGALVEGNSIRSTERMVDVHRDTVTRLMVEVGTGCEKLMEIATARNPHHRLTRPVDVARCIAALCGENTYWMTGNTLRVDGGEGSVG